MVDDRRIPQPARVPTGAKARGLLLLPPRWTPPFVSLEPEAIEDLCAAGVSSADAALVRLVDQASGRLLVRSDGADEALHPGTGRSVVTAADLEEVRAALGLVASSSRAAAVVQAVIEPAVVGLLSNERRVAERASEWTLEGALEPGRPLARLISAAARTPTELEALSPQEAVDALRGLARHLQDRGGRWRSEWLWDGTRIWVVQADPVTEPSKAERPLGRLQAPVRLPRGRLRGSRDFAGRKLSRWRAFERLDLPRTDLLVVDGAGYHASDPQDLANAIAALGAGPTVVRTDLAADADPLLLPTSGPMRTPSDALAYMDRIAEGFAQAGLGEHRWAFLIAELVSAQASAWAEVDADGAVTITALWGYPDGLLHLPHDTCTVAVDGAVSVSRVYKPACIAPAGNAWTTRQVPPPFDWDAVLDESEVRAIAVLARVVAADAGPGQLLVLAQVGGRRGPDWLLPFHFTALTSTALSATSPLNSGRAELVVRRPWDLEEAARDVSQASVIRVEPDPDRLRDPEFLRAVGRWASCNGAAIVFAGSILGHAFHLLSAGGAPVTTAASSELPDPTSRLVVVVETGQPERVEAMSARRTVELATTTLAMLALDPRGDLRLARRALAALDLDGGTGGVAEAGFESFGAVSARAWTVRDPTRSSVPLMASPAGGAVGATAERSWPSTSRNPLPPSKAIHPLPGDGELEVEVAEGRTTIRVREAP